MSTINREVKQEILGKVKAGEEVKKIAAQYGVSDRTIYAWLKQGVTDKISTLEYGKLKKENLILKEIVGILTVEVEKLKKRPGSKTNLYRELISLVKDQLAVKAIELKDCLVAKLLGISQSSFFYQPKLNSENERLREQILFVLASNPSYGHRRIAIALGVGRKKIRRVMKLYGIKPYKRKGRWRKRRDERRPEAVFTNQIKGIFPLFLMSPGYLILPI